MKSSAGKAIDMFVPWRKKGVRFSPLASALCLGSMSLLCSGVALTSELYINEVMSSNSSTIADEDGEYSDWIELYNAGAAAIDLTGYGLTDDPDDAFRWTFPEVSISAQGHLLLFASGKNRKEILHWETVIAAGDEWTYRAGSSEPPSNWYRNGFDDSGWSRGPSGFGYGDNDDATTVPVAMSLYIRKEFPVAALEDVQQAFLHVDYDDAFVAYLNGGEIARANIGQTGFRPPHNQGAKSDREAVMYQGYPPEPFDITSVLDLLQPADNVLAIQVHNSSISSSDLTLIPFVTLGYAHPPEDPRGAPDVLNLPRQHLHTNFKVSAEGETLVLTDPYGVRVDRIETSLIPADVSLGRSPDGAAQWMLFAQPTPGAVNGDQGYEGMVDAPQFSHSGEFYVHDFDLSITIGMPGAILHYTMDGSEPDESSIPVSGAIPIDKTTVVRARAFKTGWLPCQTVTHTYFFDVETTLPVMSLSTDPSNLWDEQIGIYTYGDSYSPEFPYFGANFWEDWERPIHLELFETGGQADLNMDAGAKIYGAWSRGNPQKSLAIFARSMYGYSEIDYPLFPDRPFQQYQAFVLRNSGNDWGSTMMRDGLAATIVGQLGVDVQAYRPVVVFLNGEYWGIHNLREKINEHFLASHHHVDPDYVDRLENNGAVLQGDREHYDMMLNFLETHDLSVQENFDSVQTMMDVDDFIRYQIAEIFVNNRDWPGNNLKYWRPRTPDGKWKWIFYDADFGFGLYDPAPSVPNTLEFAAEPNGPDWPNPPWSTYIFRRLLENESFRSEFINTFCDHLNTTFQSGRAVALLDSLSNAIAPEMPNHIARWNSIWGWDGNINVVRQFLLTRPGYSRIHLQQFFDLDNMVMLHLDVSPEGAGEIQINSIFISEFPWQGHYFPGLPITISAQPRSGFRFSGWMGVPQGDSSLSFTLEGNSSFTALFEPDLDSALVVINEINYNSSDSFNPEDWIELHNAGTRAISLEGWIMKDSEDDHAFVLHYSSPLMPGEYVVLCRDTALFTSRFPEVGEILGNLGYGLSGDGEYVRLYDQSGLLVDSVDYDDKSPWPDEPDGDGPTLELIDPHMDNSLFESWAASTGHGTPGEINSASGGDSAARGDVNGDGQIDILDVIGAVNHILGSQILEGDALVSADCNGDGHIDILDTLGIVNTILEISQCEP